MVKNAPDLKGGAYLLYGKEEFLKNEFIQKLRRDLFPSPQDSEMGFRQFEVPEEPLSALFDFLENPSFFVSQKLAVLYGLDELEAEDRE